MPATLGATALLFAVVLGGETGDFQLSLIREYGRALYTRCRLNVGVFQGRGVTELWCELNPPPGRAVPPVFEREKLSADDTWRLRNLFHSARLYGAGHIGGDSTAADGIFETLKVMSSAGTVVLVTSGNKTFETDSARKGLLSLLRRWEQQLSSRVRQRGERQ